MFILIFKIVCTFNESCIPIISFSNRYTLKSRCFVRLQVYRYSVNIINGLIICLICFALLCEYWNLLFLLQIANKSTRVDDPQVSYYKVCIPNPRSVLLTNQLVQKCNFLLCYLISKVLNKSYFCINWENKDVCLSM